MSTEFRPRRSVLYMPGSNARVLEKAKTLPADCLILDLEDAVAPDMKETAREQVANTVTGGGYGKRELIIRVNGLGTPWGEEDLKAAIAATPDAILLPKVESPEDIEKVSAQMNAAGAPDSLRLWAMMETPLAMLRALEIGQAAKAEGSRLSAWVMGTNDLSKETGAQLGGNRLPMLSWLSTCIASAKAFGITIIDGVYNDFRDEEGFKKESLQGLSLGMDGKTLIHPGQIAVCNEVFSPSSEAVEMAHKIIAAFDLPENQGKGAITIEGKMVELLHCEMARRTVAISTSIAEMQAEG